MMEVFTYKKIEYSVKRSKRKTASIYIERDGSVSLLTPESFTTDMIEKMLESQLYQIYKHIANWEDLNTTRVYREFVNGEGFLYLGSSYRLQIVEDQATPLLLKHGFFKLRKKELHKAREVFKDFYKTKIVVKINERINLFADKLGVNPNSVKIMDLQNRWASCSTNGNLNFNWKCAMAPLKVLDYIVAHELVHLIHPNHNEAFWNELDKILPDYHQRKTWLKINGASMEL